MDDLQGHIPQPDAGIILVDGSGRLGATHTTNAMPIAWVDEDGTLCASMTMHRWLK
jgi:isoaspartyl peptidase/L-asparaginase-like protein (Ntn-hydrolase superfamily)